MPNNIKNEHVSNDKSTAFVDDKKIYNKMTYGEEKLLIISRIIAYIFVTISFIFS